MHGAEDGREREADCAHEAELTGEGEVLDAVEAVLD
jgi:hypothetical protein